MKRVAVPLFAVIFALTAIAAATHAADARAMRTIDHGGVYIGNNVHIEPGDVVDGDVTVIGGNAWVDGSINGQLTVLAGDVVHGPGSAIGNVVDVFGKQYVSAFPWTPNNDAQAFGTNWRTTFAIFSSILVLLFFLIFPARTRMALDRLELHPGLSALVGLLAFVAVIPIAIMLIATLILAPLVIVEAVALVAGVFIGKAALVLLVGRRLWESIAPRTTCPPLCALVCGLVLVTSAELIPIVGFVVTGLVWMVGLGAAILAFIREQTFAGAVPVTPRPPISGPPMTIG